MHIHVIRTKYYNNKVQTYETAYYTVYNIIIFTAFSLEHSFAVITSVAFTVVPTVNTSSVTHTNLYKYILYTNPAVYIILCTLTTAISTWCFVGWHILYSIIHSVHLPIRYFNMVQ